MPSTPVPAMVEARKAKAFGVLNLTVLCPAHKRARASGGLLNLQEGVTCAEALAGVRRVHAAPQTC
jgi:hypothetical protein